MMVPEEILKQQKYHSLKNLNLICQAMDEYKHRLTRYRLLNRDAQLLIQILNKKIEGLEIEYKACKNEYDSLDMNNEIELTNRRDYAIKLNGLQGEIKGLEYAIDLLQDMDTPFK